jgi:dTDP-glucose 4,6-dehydratase
VRETNDSGSFWTDKRVLVTGAGGFIGSHLVEHLVECGATVRALIHYNSAQSWGLLTDSPLQHDFEVVLGDVRDRESLKRAFQDVHTVFHLAALVGIPYSYHSPISYVRTNIEGTLNVLELAREFSVQRVVQTSTSEVYGTAQYVPIDEAHPLQGQSPYAASKIAADKLAESFHYAYGLNVTLVRPFNTFGPRQSARAVIPSIITQCLTQQTVCLGNTDPTRDFTYVSDTVDAFLCAAASPEAVGHTLHFGSGREVRIADLAHLIGALTGGTVDLRRDANRVRPEASEVQRLVADTTRAQELLGWTPQVTLEDGWRCTIAWVERHLKAYRPAVYAV